MWLSRPARLALLAGAVGTTLVAGAKSVTNAASGVDPLVADDVHHATPVHRTTPYTTADAHPIELDASGGSGAVAYRVIAPPESAGEIVGTARVTGDAAAVTIEPTAEPGPATLRYQAYDRDGRRSEVATVFFDIANRPPQTRHLTLSTPRDTPLDLWPYARDAEDGGPFPWQREGNRVRYAEPAHGTVRTLATGGPGIGHKAVYTPDPGYVGADSFTYTFTDTEGGRSTGAVTVDVAAAARRNGSADVLYRCPVRIDSDGSTGYDPDATRVVSRAIGGDLLIRVRARTRLPRRLESGRPYEATPLNVKLTLSRSTAAMLAGRELTGGGVALGRAGLGQTTIGASVTAALPITETATDTERTEPVSGLRAGSVPLTLPPPNDGVALTMRGSLPGRTAPDRGTLVVSMPQRFRLDTTLEPGVQGVIGSLGMRCRAVADQNLRLAAVPVLTPGRTTTERRAVLRVTRPPGPR